MTLDIHSDSAFLRRRRLHAFVCEGALHSDVLGELLPAGQPHLYEKVLWDYKETLPVLPRNQRLSDEQRIRFDCDFAKIVKDAVAFYNSYGGYIVVGVQDNPRVIVGFSGQFDCGLLNKKITAVTKHDVDCHFTLLDFVRPDGQKVSFGLLLIPQRPPTKEPAQFLRDAPTRPGSKQAFSKGSSEKIVG